MAFGRYSDEPKKIRFNSDFVTNRNVNAASNHKKGGLEKAQVEDLLTFAATDDDDLFTVNVPSDAGGAGYDITVRFVSGDPSDGTANEVQVGLSTPVNTRNRLVHAVNGLDSSVVKYGAGSGDVTNGIAGITAAGGTDPTATITATNAGIPGNNIVFTDGARGAAVENGALSSPATLTGGTDNQIVPFSVNIRGPANLRGRTAAYKVTT